MAEADTKALDNSISHYANVINIDWKAINFYISYNRDFI